MTKYLEPGALVAGIAADYYLQILPSSRGYRLVESEGIGRGRAATLHGIFGTYDAAAARANELLSEEESVSGHEHERFQIVKFELSDVVVCSCGEPMIPNLSTGDDDGYGWSCTNMACGDWAGGEIESEDLIACGCPEWLARRIAALSDAVAELEEGGK